MQHKTETAERVTSPEILAPQQSAEQRGVAVSTKTTTPSAVQVSREWEKQLDLIRKTVAPNLTAEEFEVFCHVSRMRNLDPLQKQIYAVKRNQWDPDEKKMVPGPMTLQTGIDGFRAIANRTGLYMPSPKEPKIEGKGTADLSITFYVLKFSLMDKQYHEYSAIAHYREFVQTKREKNDKGAYVVKPNSMWEKMPYNQLEKCAEAKALRRGWPEELGQIYVEEEMQHLDSQHATQPTVEQPNSREKAKGDASALSKSAEPNRGHGNEGTATGSSPTQAANKKSTKKADAKDEKPKKEAKPKETYIMTPHLDAVDEKSHGEGEKKRVYQLMKCRSQKGVKFSVFNWHKSYFDKVKDGVGKDIVIQVFDAPSSSNKDESFTNLDELLMVGEQKVKKLEDGTVIYENPDAEIDAAAAAITTPEDEAF